MNQGKFSSVWYSILSIRNECVETVFAALKKHTIPVIAFEPRTVLPFGIIFVSGHNCYEQLISFLNIQVRHRGDRIIVINTATTHFSNDEIFRILSCGAEYFFESSLINNDFGIIAEKINRWRNIESILSSQLIKKSIAGESITSLAKGFGVPIAAISSAKTFIDEFKSSSLTIECSSPANAVEISAALNALNINRQVGDSRRKKLLKNILFAKENLKKQGINTAGGIFPVQSLSFRTIDEASAAFDRLSSKGIETVMTAGHTDRKDVSFIINCNHSFNDIRELVNSF